MTHKTKATGGGRQWENTKHKPEHHSDLLAGGQSVRFAPMTLGLTEGHYGEYAGLLVGCQLFDSMPRLSNSRRKSLLIHPDRLSSPSSFMAILKRSNKSASRRSCTENLSFLLSLVDMINLCSDNAIKVTMYTNDTTKTTPRSGGTHAGRLTKPLTGVTIMAGTQHTPRLAHTQTAFVWRFIALSTAQPRVITIEATSEQEARQQSPDGCVMVLASRFHHRCLFFVCLSSGYGVVPFQRMRGRSLMKRSSGKLSDGAGGRTRRSRLRWRTTLASVISPDSFIFIKSYLRAHLLWRFLFLMKTYSGSGVSYFKIWFNFSCLALMTARNNICRCFVFTSRTVGDNMDLFMVLTCNALRRDASYHGGGYRFVRIRPLMKSSSGKCSGRGNSGGTGLLLMRSRSLAARAAFSFCRSTSNGTPLSFMVPPVYPLLTDGYRCIFRTNYLINTSDHIIREPEYTGAIIPHLLAYAQLTADMALNEAKAILIADCEYGVMRDDRFNALKQEFDGTPEDTDIALLCVADMVKAACFLLETAEHSGTGSDILNIASDYAEYVAEARYRRKFQEVVSHE